LLKHYLWLEIYEAALHYRLADNYIRLFAEQTLMKLSPIIKRMRMIRVYFPAEKSRKVAATSFLE
jgi:hypothetical protein